MEIDWAQAWQVGGIGFGLVFAVLAILAVVTWLFSRISKRNGNGSDEAEAAEKEE
jgi:Na+-transporting methylmalonyl-CoA/oxaloacetate decarboxylase gamma subunit